MSGTPPPDDDATVRLPRPPGGRPGAAPRSTPAAPPEAADDEATVFGDATVLQSAPAQPAPAFAAAGLPPGALPAPFGSPNLLLAAAGPLLALVGALRTTPTCDDIEELRQRLIASVRQFEQACTQARLPAQDITSARYALCSLIDEAIAATPWGGGIEDMVVDERNRGQVWAFRSLLLIFHNEGWGGENFFVILDRASKDPSAHIDLLELLYVCIALGFEGRYHAGVHAGGRAQLARLSEQLLELIRRHRPPPEADLSPHWQGVVDRRRRFGIEVPVWLLALALALVLAIFHIGFGIHLNGLSDPVFARIQGIQVAALPASPVSRIAVTAPKLPRLAELLGTEIAAGQLGVSEGEGRATVTLHGDGLFGSGSATVEPAYLPILGRIRDALQNYPGTVIVTGHTDDQRIVSARFPSNWHLSVARAQAVVQVLAAGASAPQRFRPYGRGETDPLVPNTSAEARARNRRVDITITGAPGG